MEKKQEDLGGDIQSYSVAKEAKLMKKLEMSANNDGLEETRTQFEESVNNKSMM